MNRRWLVASVLALVLAFSGSAPADSEAQGAGNNVVLQIDDVSRTLFTSANIVVKAKITLPQGAAVASCLPAITLFRDGTQIAQQTVGSTGGVTTNPDGTRFRDTGVSVAQTWEPPTWKAGTYKLSATMVSKPGCSGAPSNQGTVTVKPASSVLAITPAGPASKTKPYSFTVSLTRNPSSVPLANKPITVNVCGSNWPGASTNAAGQATFTRSIANCPVEKFTISVKFAGDVVNGFTYAEKEVSFLALRRLPSAPINR